MWLMLQLAMRASHSGSGRACLLTTHSLDEAEALSTRLGIMVNGRFRCIGRAAALKKAHGGGLELQVKLQPGAISEVFHSATAAAGVAGLPHSELQRERFLLIFTQFICALVDAARQPRSDSSHGQSSEAARDSAPDEHKQADALDASDSFDLNALPPLPGFPFEQMPASLPPLPPFIAESTAIPSAAPAVQLPSARLTSASPSHGLLTFVLPSPVSTAAPSFSLATFFAYMQRYRSAYGVGDFSLQQSTLEGVFLKFAREQIAADE